MKTQETWATWEAELKLQRQQIIEQAGCPMIRFTVDSTNRLLTVNHTLGSGGTSLARFDYGYDAVNRRTYEQRNQASGDVFSYDAVDQVTGVSYDATNPTSGTTGTDRTVGYAYDATGNRTLVTDSVNGNTGYSTNADNQYTSVAGSAYSYDGNGNLIGGNGGYTYDAQNRLTFAQVTTGTGTTTSTGTTTGTGATTGTKTIAQMSYDGKNRVVKRTIGGTTTYYVYDGWNLIEEHDSGNALLASYVHGVRPDEMLTRTAGGATVFYHQNALGSTAVLTDASGSVVEKYKYDVFGTPAITDGAGNPLAASNYGNRFLFAGREYLAGLALYDYRNRVYSAALGRFLQTDPMRFSAGDVNIYRYCGNSPVNMVDPRGLNGWWAAAGAAAGALLSLPVDAAEDLSTGGVGVLANPATTGAMTTGGAAVGQMIDNALNNISNNSSATGSGADANNNSGTTTGTIDLCITG